MLLIMLFNRNSWYVFIVTDTHQKLLLCRQGGRPLHSQNLSVLFLPLYPWTSANRVCVGNKGRKEHSPLPRGIKHKSTDAQVLEFKPLSFMDPNQKIQADENIGPICLTSCFLWSHTQLYFPRRARMEHSFAATQLQQKQPMEDFTQSLLRMAVCPETCCYGYPSLGMPSRSQQHGQRLMFILCFFWHPVNGKAEPSLLKPHVWSEPYYVSTMWWSIILMRLSAPNHAWRWQHLSSEKFFLPFSIRPSLF